LKKRLILIFFVALLLGVGLLVIWGQRQKRTAELYYSGTLEATTANLAFQISGRVKEVLVDEGAAVENGQLLAVLNPEEFLAQRDQAQANLTKLEENLKQLQALLELNRQALPAEVERSEAAARAFQAQVAEFESGYRRQEVERARLAVEEARVTMEEARKNQIRFDTLFRRGVVAEREKDATDLKYLVTQREYEQASAAYELAREGFRKESIETARARLAEANAGAKLARSNLKRIDAAEREVDAARAQVDAARAAFELAQIQLNRTELRAPFSGTLVSRNVEPGEVVTPAREVLSVSDLSVIDLKLYVDETEIGKIKPGQNVDVKIDTFPSKTYPGRVAYISPEAEFTPKIIQTHKERVKLVYLVKVTIANPDLELKSGLPADAWFR